MSCETNTDKPQEPIGQLPETQPGSQMSYETNTTDTSVGHQYQQMPIDAVLREKKDLQERLRVMTMSRDALLVKNRRIKCQANSRIFTWRQLECKIVSLKYRSDYSSFLRITYNVQSLRLSFVNFAALFTKQYLRKCVRSLFRLHFSLLRF